MTTGKFALVYGSCTGKTEYIAESMIEKFQPEIELTLVDVSSMKAPDLTTYEFAICAIPTWDVGELEYGWADVYDDLDDLDLKGLTVAMLGLGDQRNYGETYQDAMGILYDKMIERGAKGGLGFTSVEGHEFEESLAVKGEQFCGLALDEDNQYDLTDERIEAWVKQVKEELAKLKESQPADSTV